MQTWEYLVTSMDRLSLIHVQDSPLIKNGLYELSELGAQGWELVCVHSWAAGYNGNMATALFKRPGLKTDDEFVPAV